MSFGHSEVSFNHSCLKVPVHSASQRPAPKYERSLSVKCSQSHLNRDKMENLSSDLYVNSVKKYLDFYESIPDYSELHHLSNEEFYSRLKSLKITQKRLCSESGIWSSFISEDGLSREKFRYDDAKADKGGGAKEELCRYVTCTPDKDYCLLSELHEKKTSKSRDGASLGVKQPPPKINVISDNENISDLYEPECKKNSDYEADRESSTLQVGEVPGRSGKVGEGEEKCLWEGCSRRSRSLPVSPGCECGCAGVCNGFLDPIFRHRNDTTSKDQQSLVTKTKKIHSREIPLTSRIPLFDKIMMEKEARRRIIHDLYSEELRSLVKPFSFTKREEEKERLRMISSNPELTALNPPVVRFRAKPIPKNLFSNYAYERMKEEEFYRALKRRVRAEEMLKSSSLPPSMALREKKSRSKSLDFLDCRCARRSWLKNCGYRRPCKDVRREIEFEEDVKNREKRKSRPSWMAGNRRINSATDSSTEISPYESVLNAGRRKKERPHSAFHCSRNNLASVLRIETARKRLEKEMEEKLKENRLKDEARFKAHLARKNPAWRALRYDKNEDLALRLVARRQEERLKKENHQRLMESIYGRVYRMPPLFHKERFFNGKHFVCSEEKDQVAFPESNSAEKAEKEVMEPVGFGRGHCRSRDSSELTITCEKNEGKTYESDDTANET